MARPIYKDSETSQPRITFFSLQPIHLEYARYSELLFDVMPQDRDDWMKISDTCDASNGRLHQRLVDLEIDCEWVESLRRVRHYDLSIHLSSMTAFNADLEMLNNDHGEFKYLNHFNLDADQSGYLLCFDTSNRLFLILYKLTLEYTGDLTRFDDDQFRLQMSSLYQNIRDLLVVDPVNDNHDVSIWTKKIRIHCLAEVYKAYSSALKLNRSELYIRDNTGYIAAFFNSDFCADPVLSRFDRDNFLVQNHAIDKVADEKTEFRKLDILDGSENIDLFLGWRHSTVWGIDQDKSSWLLSLMVHLQCHYFISHLFYKAYLEELFADIRYESKRRHQLGYYLNLFDQLVLSFQNLYYLRERYLNDIKPIYREVYDKMESYWGLDKDYRSIEKAIAICKESVDRKVQIVDSIVQNRQSNILFFLAIVQIFSFVGIFSDYFGFFTIDVIQNHKETYQLLRKYLMPVLFASASLALIVTYNERVKSYVKFLVRSLFGNSRE